MIEFDVRIHAGDLYDYMLKHTYSGFSGMFGNLTGAVMVIAGLSLKAPLMAVAGVILLCYLPWTLYLKSKQQILSTPAFKAPLHYKLDDEGIHVSQGEQEEMQKWEDIYKAVSTGRSLIVYTSRVNACIFPKRELGDHVGQVIQVLASHLPSQRMKIRG